MSDGEAAANKADPAVWTGPPRDCSLCPRLAAFRADNRRAYPAFFNAPVPSFGSQDAPLLVVGLAPGLKGANRTGRPFTGDFAGELLYGTLKRFGFAEGDYAARADDGLVLRDCRITNAVRCVPPENKPTGMEVTTCRAFLAAELAALPHLRVVVALGAVAHRSLVAATGMRQAACPFVHGAWSVTPGGLEIGASYHCSRYNTATGRLTPAMFHAVFAEARRRLDAAGG